MLTHTFLGSLEAACSKARIAVIGDLMLDRYLFGTVSRISPEAPVPVLDIQHDEIRLGGAANVGHNIHTLESSALLFGVVGEDSKGERVKQLMSGIGLETSGIVSDHSRPTTIKTRVVAGSHQMLRVDHERKHHIPASVEDKLLAALGSQIETLDGIILEDYNKGVLTPRIIRESIRMALEHGIPVFVDPKHDNFFEYKRATVFKPNKKEIEDALGLRLADDDNVRKAGFKLLDMLQAENVLLTLSEKGMMLFERGEAEPFSIPTRARQVADVSGAGDTVIATLAVAKACGASLREAAMIANRAAGLVVEELGIVPIRKSQLFEALYEDVSLEQ